MVAAIAATPLLVALYLLKLRRRPVRVSTIRFWPGAGKDIQANIPLRMIRPSLLLLLHALLLAMLIAAIGRPAVPGGDGGGERIVLVIDASASMAAIDAASPDPGEARTRLAAAKQRALEVIDASRRGPGRREFAVLVFSADARLVTTFTSSRAALTDAINAVSPSDQPGNLGEALKLLSSLRGDGEDAEADAPPTAILFSDGAFRDAGRLPPTPIPVRYERIAGAEDPDNLGLVALAARRDASDPGVVRVFVDVLNSSSQARSTGVTISLNGRVLVRHPLDIPGRASTSGRTNATLDVRAGDGGVLLATIDREDSLESDNAASLVLPPATRPGIWLVSPEGAADAPDRPGSWLLADALAELRARSFERLTPDEYARRVVDQRAQGVNLIVFDRVRPAQLPPTPTLHFGDVPPLNGITLEGEAEPAGAMLWKRTHPILRYVSLDTLVVSRSPRLRITDGAGLEALVDGTHSPLMLLADDSGVRRIIVPFDLTDSNWPLQAGFPVFLASAADFLTLRGEASVGVAFRTDEPASITATGRGELVLRGPTELRATTTGPGIVRVGPAPFAGVYLLSGPTRDLAVGINLADEVESSLANPARVEIAGREIESPRAAPEPREVWHWFVLAALALLTIEWLVYARAMRA